jgi:hypothetical protein
VQNNFKRLERNFVRKRSGYSPSPFWKNTLAAPMIATMFGRKEIMSKNIPSLPLNDYFKKLYIL